MKKVFSSVGDVIHAFAQRNQSEGRCSNVYFEHDVCYSYGRHYVLAEFITNDRGELAVMINNKGYSNTTAKHIGYMRQATRQYKQFLTMSSNHDAVLGELQSLERALGRANKPMKYITEAKSLFVTYSNYCEWANISMTAEILEAMKVFSSSSEDVDAYIKESKAKAKLAEIKKVEAFMSHEASRVYGSKEDYVRISLDGCFVETSQDLSVPIKEAAILYTMIKNGRDIIGHKINGYTVLGLNGVLKVGCHHINRKNMEQVGELILTM